MQSPISHLFHHREFSDSAELVRWKNGATIALVIPTLNEEATIEGIITVLRSKLIEEVPLLDRIVVVDSGSSDATVSRAMGAGAEVIIASDVLPELPAAQGKGENLYKATHAVKADILCFLDGDIREMHPRFVCGLVGPLLRHSELQFVKAFYDRPTQAAEEDSGNRPQGGGRVTEILVRPLFSLFRPELSRIIQPLSGEYAARRSLLQQLPFPVGYGIEMAHLMEIESRFGMGVIAQTDLEERIHRHHGTADLGRMAFAILQVFLRRLPESDRRTAHGDRASPAGFTSQVLKSFMRIAILHYHLQAGGVGRIIDLAAQALTGAGHEVAVIAGSAPHARSLLDRSRIGIVPGLNYRQQCGDVGILGKEVDETARKVLGSDPDLWHIHNPTLGKNPMLPMLMARWAQEGRALVLQLHDFAEQERPANYQGLVSAAKSAGIGLREFLYPMHPRVRYAVLTSHDAALLAAAGLKTQAIVLPNPGQALPVESPFPSSLIEAEEYLVYPTRAIARKNLGETLLWASRLKPGQKLVITQAPEEIGARKEHDLWEAFAMRHDLPVVFDSVARFGRPLGDFIAGSQAAITTSISEGFGMAYLDPWLLGRAVVGRGLPKITADFHAAGISFDWLYSGIPVDLTAEESTLHEAMFVQRWREKALGYGVSLCEPSLPDVIDFGHLQASLQRRILERWIATDFAGVSLPDLQVDKAVSHIDFARHIMTKNFGLEGYAHRLEELYEAALSSNGGSVGESPFLNPESVLAEFLNGSE